ncbi:MAG: hypothetical protein EOO15_11890 [Chitinophagaceae bacterium]|nr:MAG: hypothetical protein EOO15_11890 [Chitinophagaceae bacterium]
MKGLINVLLLFLVLLQAFSKWVIIADFEANQQFIARTLCENRQRPTMKCGGKCQLAKRMAEEEKGATQRSLRISIDEITFSPTDFSVPPVPVQELSRETEGQYLVRLTQPLLPQLRKPPAMPVVYV